MPPPPGITSSTIAGPTGRRRRAIRAASSSRRGSPQLDTLPVGDSPQDQLTARLLRDDFALRLEAWDLDTHLLRVGQLDGFHNLVYDTVDLMPARSVRDYENIIARLRSIPAYVDQNLGILDEAVAAGIMQPRVVADLVIQQIDAQLAQDAEHTQLLKAFRAFPSNLPRADQDRLRREALEAFEQQFLPSWRKLRTYMAQTYLPRVRPADSIASMKDGRAAYTILIHRLTTTRLSGADIHRLGEQEVARIEGEMQAIARNAGLHRIGRRFPEEARCRPGAAFPLQGGDARQLAKHRDDHHA